MDLSALMALEPSLVRCPYDAYAACREEGVSYDESADAYVVSRHAEVAEALRDGATFSSCDVLGRPLPPPDEGSGQIVPLLLVTDDPEHARRRQLVARAFTPRQMRRFEPAVADWCTRLADAMLADAKLASDEIDFVADFAAPLPIRVIATVLGVPTSEADAFRHWSEEVTHALGSHEADPERRRRAGVAFAGLVGELLDARAGLDPETVFGVIAEAEAAGTLTRFESVRLTMELIVAGNITTTDHLANSVLLLAERPDLVAALRADPSRIPAFVEESLRLEGPVQGFYRRCLAERRLGEATVPAGSRLLVLYGAANRDPDRFEAPDELVLDRAAPTSHLAFGFGSHTCLGAPLARMESRIAFETLLGRIAAFEVDTDRVEYLASYINHGPTRLPMRVELAPAAAGAHE